MLFENLNFTLLLPKNYKYSFVYFEIFGTFLFNSTKQNPKKTNRSKKFVEVFKI